MDINILHALDVIPADLPRDDWYKILAAVKSGLGDAGREVAENWSKGADSYKEVDFNSTWNSLNGNGGITIGTLFHFAKPYGYKPEKVETHNDPIKLNQPAIEQSKGEEQPPCNDSHALVAMNCVNRWSQAEPAKPDHPYLVDKGVPALGIKQEGENLLIPMRDGNGRIWSLQTIAPDAKKRFAKGSTTKGMYFRIPGDGPVVICEGFATGSTIHEATGYNVVIAFNCGNLDPVAHTIREKVGNHRIIIAADSAPETTTEKGAQVARAVGAGLAVPTVDSDFNDLFQSEGYHAVKTQIDGATELPETLSGGFAFLSLGQIRKNLKGAQYLVKPFLERETSAVLFGEPGAYKSFVCLDLGLCIAFGIPYHGYKTNPGPVFYICGEGESGISRRVESWLIDHNLTNSNAPFFVSSIPASLIEEGNALEIANIIANQTAPPPALIVVDTLSTNIGDGDESSNPDVAVLMKNINQHIRDRFKACVLIVHHVGHADKERERGASALSCNADVRMMVKAEGDYSCSLHSLKVKDGSRFEPVMFRARQVAIPGITDSEGEEVNSLALEMQEYVENPEAGLTDQHQQALAVLRDMYSDRRENITAQGRNPDDARVEVKDWFARMEKLRVVKKGASRQAKNKIKAALKTADLIRDKDGCVYPDQPKNDDE